MALFRFKSKGKVRQLVDLVYPVGSIYISTASTNPGTLFGGTWEAFAPGRVLIGAGQGNDGTTSMSFTAGASGGKYKHQITNDESKVKNLVQGGVTGWVSVAWEQSPSSTNLFKMNESNVAMSLVQPYITVFVWRRTA